ncbi:hypothetical protein GC163_21595 [bacterium]|nr:hypothetical protein [bacterium]
MVILKTRIVAGSLLEIVVDCTGCMIVRGDRSGMQQLARNARNMVTVEHAGYHIHLDELSHPEHFGTGLCSVVFVWTGLEPFLQRSANCSIYSTVIRCSTLMVGDNYLPRDIRCDPLC